MQKSVLTVGRRVLALPIALVVELRLLRLVGAHTWNGTGGGSWHTKSKAREGKREHTAEVRWRWRWEVEARRKES